jgi:hypothetical protein
MALIKELLKEIEIFEWTAKCQNYLGRRQELVHSSSHIH